MGRVSSTRPLVGFVIRMLRLTINLCAKFEVPNFTLLRQHERQRRLDGSTSCCKSQLGKVMGKGKIRPPVALKPPILFR